MPIDMRAIACDIRSQLWSIGIVNTTKRLKVEQINHESYVAVGKTKIDSIGQIAIEIWRGPYFDNTRPLWVGFNSTKREMLERLAANVKFVSLNWDDGWSPKNTQEAKRASFTAMDHFESQYYFGRYYESNPNVADDAFAFIAGLFISSDPQTARRIEATSRIGQGPFRKLLSESWGDKCAVTGFTVEEALRASHIKPWSEFPDCRLDANNGILLVATLDALFDKHLITFNDDGSIIISSMIPDPEKAGLNQNLSIRKPLNAKQKSYLKWHREEFHNRNRN